MADSESIPFYDSLKEVYDPTIVEEQQTRYQKVHNEFQKLYNSPPKYIVRAPGRGEHIDYSNFPVLPMAIAPDILVALKIDEKESQTPVIYLANMNKRFPKREIEIDTQNPKEPVSIDSKTLGTVLHSLSFVNCFTKYNYFKAGYLGHLQYNPQPPTSFKGMKILIDGTVPTGSGLSSSAAFVVSSLISSLLASTTSTHPQFSKESIVRNAMISERNVGVNSGGMDQAASVFSTPRHAVYIQFYPSLRASTVSFPPDVTFVIANSNVNADKHDTAPEHYNLRVVETTCSAEVLARQLGLGRLKERDGFGGTLREVVEKYYHKTEDDGMGKELGEFLDVVKDVFKGEGEYTHTELGGMLGLTEYELYKKYMMRFPVRAPKFKLLKRTRHVLSEARRVQSFRSLLQSTAKDEEKLYKELGRLMDLSQDSCRDDFECSCPELDELCVLARKYGAYGARLTGTASWSTLKLTVGAGWGGAIVALTTKKDAQKVVDGLIKEYYNVKFPEMSKEELDKAVFATQPESGALVYTVGEKGIQ